MKGMVFLCCFLPLSLVACSKHDPKDLKQYLVELKQRPEPVENLAEFKTYEPVTYQAYKNRSPFVPFDLKPVIKRKEEAVVTELESYPLHALTMVGTLSNSDTTWALVRTPVGTVYQTKVGQTIGAMGGRVLKIEDQAMTVEEGVVDDAQGSSMKKEILPLQTMIDQEKLK